MEFKKGNWEKLLKMGKTPFLTLEGDGMFIRPMAFEFQVLYKLNEYTQHLFLG